MSRPSSGYVTLLTVLVVGTASLAIALALLTTGTDSSRAGLASQQAAQARSLSAACAEEALQRVRDVSTYIGTATINIGAGSCSYAVTGTGVLRSIDAFSSVGQVVHKLKIYVTINPSSISVTSWQDVT